MHAALKTCISVTLYIAGSVLLYYTLSLPGHVQSNDLHWIYMKQNQVPRHTACHVPALWISSLHEHFMAFSMTVSSPNTLLLEVYGTIADHASVSNSAS